MENLIKMGHLIAEAGKCAASQENCQLFAAMARRVDEFAAAEMQKLRGLMCVLPPAQSTELTILFAKADRT